MLRFSAQQSVNSALDFSPFFAFLPGLPRFDRPPRADDERILRVIRISQSLPGDIAGQIDCLWPELKKKRQHLRFFSFGDPSPDNDFYRHLPSSFLVDRIKWNSVSLRITLLVVWMDPLPIDAYHSFQRDGDQACCWISKPLNLLSWNQAELRGDKNIPRSLNWGTLWNLLFMIPSRRLKIKSSWQINEQIISMGI